MAEYKIYFKESVTRDFRRIQAKDIQLILQRIKTLEVEARPSGCEKLTSQERYRIRQGQYRILYTIQDKQLTIWIVKVGHRKSVYR